MEKKVRGAQPPGRIRVRPLLVATPKPGAPLRVTWLSNLPFGLLLHWRPAGPHGKARHFVCLQADCKLCEKSVAEWRGYLAAYDHNSSLARMVPLTEAGWALLQAWAYGKSELRGLPCEIMRSTPNPSSAYHFATIWGPDKKTVLPEPDLRPHLTQLYPEAAHLIWGDDDARKEARP